MSGKILIADDLSLNRTVLRGKLTSACYRVVTANGGRAALDVAQREQPDLVLLDYHMPDMDGIAVCKALRADPHTRDVPVILFSADFDHYHRLTALSAGADDFMGKPLDEAYLLSRIRSLLRAAAQRDEWRHHPNTALQGGFAESTEAFALPPSITVVVGPQDPGQDWCATLRDIWPKARVAQATVAETLHREPARGNADLLIVTPGAFGHAGLHVISELRSRTATRHTEICLFLSQADRGKGAMALDLGAADIVALPLDPKETRLRLEKIVTRKRATDAQRRALDSQLGLAAFDPLTGLHNRTHALMQVSRMASRLAGGEDAQFALVMIDLDHFKEVNDRYGHNAGDAILRQAANRMRHVLRHDDILCRYGGEEFLLVLPRADAATARAVADRLCDRIGGRAFRLRGSDTALSVTVSVGIAVHRIGAPSAGLEDMQALIGTADDALRQAKVRGRNRIEIARTAIA